MTLIGLPGLYVGWDSISFFDLYCANSCLHLHLARFIVEVDLPGSVEHGRLSQRFRQTNSELSESL